MVLERLDLFASEFIFNVNNNQQKTRKSVLGGFISISIIGVAIAYFTYLLNLYVNNRINPNFKMQTYISEEREEIVLDPTYFAFSYMLSPGQSLSMLESKTGKSYLEFIPLLQVIQANGEVKIIKLDIIDCQSQKLKGFQCIDFSKSQSYNLVINDNSSYNADLCLMVYRCMDTDFLKTQTRSNCGTEEETNKLLENISSYFEMKMKTAQFNTTSEEMDVRYKRFITHFQTNQMLFQVQKSMKQVTNIKKGPFIQYNEERTSVIDYQKEESSFDRKALILKTGMNAIAQINITLDEQVQYVEIQYATFLEVLSIFNSTLAVLMSIGMIGRFFSSQMLYQQFQNYLLKYLFTSSYYEMVKQSKNSDLNKNLKGKKNNQKNGFKVHVQEQKEKEEDINRDKKQNEKEGIKIDKKQNEEMKQESNNDLSDSDVISIIDENKIQSPQFSKYHLKNINSILRKSQSKATNCVEMSSQLQKNQLDSMRESSQNIKSNKEIYSPRSNFQSQEIFNQPLNQINQDSIKITLKNQSNYNSNDYDYNNNKNNNQYDFSNIIQILNNLKGKRNFKDIIKNTKNKEKLKEDKKILQQRVNEQLNIFEIMKDFFFIKKAIMILLSQEQYAAINIIGYSLQPNGDQSSHLDCIQQTNMSEDAQLKLVNQFLDRVQDQGIKSKIDQRIISSIIS